MEEIKPTESNLLSFDYWEKLDLRVATITKVEPHPNADKLYVLEIDLGLEKRTIVAGIKNYYKPEELLNTQIIVFTNLKPVVLRGVESQGMLLAASSKDKVFVLRSDKKIENGSKIS